MSRTARGLWSGREEKSASGPRKPADRGCVICARHDQRDGPNIGHEKTGQALVGPTTQNEEAGPTSRHRGNSAALSLPPQRNHEPPTRARSFRGAFVGGYATRGGGPRGRMVGGQATANTMPTPARRRRAKRNKELLQYAKAKKQTAGHRSFRTDIDDWPLPAGY